MILNDWYKLDFTVGDWCSPITESYRIDFAYNCRILWDWFRFYFWNLSGLARPLGPLVNQYTSEWLLTIFLYSYDLDIKLYQQRFTLSRMRRLTLSIIFLAIQLLSLTSSSRITLPIDSGFDYFICQEKICLCMMVLPLGTMSRFQNRMQSLKRGHKLTTKYSYGIMRLQRLLNHA
jgi:hypothetical protein